MARSHFLGATYTLASPQAAANRVVNLYPEMIQDKAAAQSRSVAYFVGCPGFKVFCDLGSAPIRGMIFASNGFLYAVCGNTLYEVTVQGVATSRGTLNTSTGVVSMADNGVHLGMADGTNGYTLTLATNAFGAIGDPDYPDKATQIVYQDTFGIVIDPGTQRFFISATNSFISWDALDFASAEGAVDDAVALISDHRELWIFGTTSTEVFYNSGAADFPFERVAGATIEHGCTAPHSVAKLDNTIFWLGQDINGSGIIWRADGYRPQRVSTHAIEQILYDQGPALPLATAFTYQQAGHSFYVLNLSDRALVYDAATGLWHERAGWDSVNGAFVAYPATCHTAIAPLNLVGGTDGVIYQLDVDTYTYAAGSVLKWLRSWRHGNSEGGIVRYASLTLDAQMGVNDAQVMLRWSNDGGITFGNEAWTPLVSLGEIGQFGNRAVWRRLGKGRDRVFEVSATDPGPVKLMGAYIDAVRG